jgi:hypothetical protein
MNHRSNIALFLAAIALSAYVFVVDRHGGHTVTNRRGDSAVFPSLEVSLVSSVELIRSNSIIRVERTNTAWAMRLPVAYPAQGISVDRLLDHLARLVPAGFVGAREVASQPDGLRAFGLEPPGATLTLSGKGQPTILRVGAKSPVAGRVYVQLVGTDGVFVVDDALLGLLPASPDDWRDRGLIDLAGRRYDRISLAAAGRTVFEAVKDPAGRWQLRQTLSARADGERLEALVGQLEQVRVAGFVSDAPVVDRASLGLQPPAYEFAVGLGTNELVRLEVGGAPTNAPRLRHVRRLSHTNVVLVSAESLSGLEHPLQDFRDPRLVGPLDGVTRIERPGNAGFVAETIGTNWWVTSPLRFPASPAMVQLFLEQIESLEIEQFVTDVVADPKAYGLDRPAREFILGHGTNALVHVQLGGPASPNGALLFARRTDEPGVYAVPRTILINLESAGQLRDWHFAGTNVTAVDIVQQGRLRRLARSPAGWQATAGSTAGIIPDAIDETLYRLGQWDSARYAVTDEPAMVKAGHFGETAHEITLTLAGNPSIRSLRLRFGASLGANRLVLAYFDNDPTPLRLEMPEELHGSVARDFAAP